MIRVYISCQTVQPTNRYLAKDNPPAPEVFKAEITVILLSNSPGICYHYVIVTISEISLNSSNPTYLTSQFIAPMVSKRPVIFQEVKEREEQSFATDTVTDHHTVHT